jgi:hypothetical protein
MVKSVALVIRPMAARTSIFEQGIDCLGAACLFSWHILARMSDLSVRVDMVMRYATGARKGLPEE